MDKDELKERIHVPLLGFSAVLMSIVAFLLLLYGITVVVRFLFALGSRGESWRTPADKTTFSRREGGALPSLLHGAFSARRGSNMWLRFTLFDVRVVAHYLGVLVSFFTIALAVPLGVAIAMQEWEPASRYLLAEGITLIVGSGLRLLCVQPGKLTHKQALAVTGLSWIVLAFVASVPLALSGHYGSYLDSLMEAVSGLTTTGVTLVIDLEHLSTADNMWRFVMHLIGGLGLIVVALSLGLLGKATSGL